MKRIIILLFISLYISGCSWISDFPRTMWGSSVRVLSAQRAQAKTEVFSCDPEQCFDHVLAMTAPYGAERSDDMFVLFLKDSKKRYMILMGVDNAVDTTEVGVFFDALDGRQTKIDIASLSSRARDAAATLIFERMAQMCEPGL